MKQYNVSMVIEVPDVGATDKEVDEFVEYKCGYRDNISITNPLEFTKLKANNVEVDVH